MKNHTSLSPKLQDLVRLAAEGLTDKAIAAEMSIKPNTVESHWKRLRAIYNTSSRTKIVSTALAEALKEATDALQLERARSHQLEQDLGDMIEATGRTAAIGHNRVTSFRQLEYSTAMEQILAAIPTVIWKCQADVSLQPQFVSNSIAKYGYTPSEFLAGIMTLTAIVDEDDHAALCKKSIFPRAKLAAKLACQYRILSSSGRACWVLERSRPMISKELELMGHQIVMIDINDLVQSGSWTFPAEPRVLRIEHSPTQPNKSNPGQS
ncbi:LuxR C-terminal-related transcriptional regulator [Kamptonema cortianum]|nr:LuxR C-terminal-related transcriptional regulator [Geitlerinema splendidum]MDK3156134.1 LuxR C-terminal-related transcriptional regulator [Kamptonema cortianum]